MKTRKTASRSIIGWREWVGLPDFGIPEIKAKIDTGARTSALHAYKIKPFQEGGKQYARFRVHPIQRRRKPEIECVAPVIGIVPVRDSGGKVEKRVVVSTLLSLGARTWPIELTLTNRDEMTFRMLIGRTAVRGKFDVDPGASFLSGRNAVRGVTGGEKRR